MLRKRNRRISVNKKAALALLALSFLQLQIHAENLAVNFAVPRLAATPGVRTQRDDGVVLLFSSLPGGIARGQTFRVSLGNFIRLGGQDQNSVEVRAQVKLLDRQGRIIAQTAELTIARNQVRSFDINRDGLHLPGEERTGRLQVREELTVQCVGVDRDEALTIRQKASEFLPASAELIDNATGESKAVNPSLPMNIWLQTQSASNPNTQGLVYGQTLRLSVFNPGEARQTGEPLRARVRLVDAQGNVVAQSAVVTIPVGEFHSFDFNRSGISLPGEPGTGRLQAAWRVEASRHGNSPATLPISIEVIDNTAGVSSSSKVAYAYQAIPLNQG